MTENLEFTYAEEQPPIENVENLSENMHFYPSVDILTGDSLLYDYEPEVCLMYIFWNFVFWFRCK